MFKVAQKSKSIVAYALALLLVLTSLAMSVGQMRAAAVGEMVLCTGLGPRTVQIDANGQPVQASVTCPETLLDTANVSTAFPGIVTSPNFVDLHVANASNRFGVLPLVNEENSARAPPRTA